MLERIFLLRSPKRRHQLLVLSAVAAEEGYEMKGNLSILNIPWPDAVLIDLPRDQPISKRVKQSETSLTLLSLYVQPGLEESYPLPESALKLGEKSDGQRGAERRTLFPQP